MTRKFMLLFLWVVMLVTTQSSFAQEAPPSDYRNLPDLRIFGERRYGQWVGSGGGLEIETESGRRLPLDESESFNELPSYRINVTGENGWWSFLLAGPNWEAYSLTPYVADGALEFNVKGATGGENFQINLNDVVAGRDPQNLASAQVRVSDFTQVTDEWQSVRIPIAAFLSGSVGFKTEQMFSISFSGANNRPLAFWINDIRFTSTSPEPSFPAIKLNQLGYLPNAPKVALVSGFSDELAAAAGTPFEVRDLRTSEAVYASELRLLTDYDSVVSGERVLAADFSEFATPGDYYLTVSAYQVDDSPQFSVGPDLYNHLLVDSLRYFYLQRSGMPLEAPYAGEFARGAGHLQDAVAEFRSGSHPPRDVSGGWYDAGDYGKYVNAGATAVSDLLWTYEIFPTLFADEQLNVPESGNGTPDLLDEVRWETDWLLKMQDPESGGFYHQVQPTEEAVIPNALETRYIEDENGNGVDIRPTSVSGSAVGALAHAAVVFAPFDADYAAELTAAAEAGWLYLQANPELIPPQNGPYSDKNDTDDRFYAAAALYRATGDPMYEAYLIDNYQVVETFFTSETDNAYGVGRMDMIAWLHIAHSEGLNTALTTHFEQLFTPWFDRMVDRWQASPWQIALLDDDYYWGSNYVALTTPFVMVVGSQALSADGAIDPTAATLGLQALDYLLGANPLRFSYVSGYGADSLSHPFSYQWSWDGIAAVPAGILAGGPNAFTNPLFYSNFAGKRYVDSSGSWTVNEHTIYWNSTLAFHAALAAHLGGQNAATFSEPAQAPDSSGERAASDPPAVVQPPAADAVTATELAELRAEVVALQTQIETLQEADQTNVEAEVVNPSVAVDPLPSWLLPAVFGWLGILSLLLLGLWIRKR